MPEKAPNAFNGIKGHEALALAALVSLPPEGPLAISPGQEPPISHGEAMGVAGKVAEDPLRPGQQWLGIDSPLRLLQSREALVPGRGRGPSLALPLPAEALLGGCLPQRGQARASKQSAEDTHREKEARGPGDPCRALHR